MCELASEHITHTCSETLTYKSTNVTDEPFFGLAMQAVI